VVLPTNLDDDAVEAAKSFFSTLKQPDPRG
jgi:hypothetical protein